MDEQAFIDAIRAADADAYRRLVEREVDPVFRLAYRILGNAQDAEDVVQDTFVTAYRAIATFRGDGSIGGWLRTIAARLALRHATRRSAGRTFDILELEVTGASPSTPSPLAGLLSDERAESIRRAIGSLPEAQREVIALRFFGDLSLPEIAEATNRPLPTCKSHLRRGLKRLQAELRAEAAA